MNTVLFLAFWTCFFILCAPLAGMCLVAYFWYKRYTREVTK